MSNRNVIALAARRRPSIGLGESGLETLCLLIVGGIGARTVSPVESIQSGIDRRPTSARS